LGIIINCVRNASELYTKINVYMYYAISVLLCKTITVLVSDIPEINLDVRHPTKSVPGWLNCTVSSRPTSNITMYRLTPLPVVIIDTIVRGENFLNYTIPAYEGVYRCSADNGLGVVVNSEVQLLENRNVYVLLPLYCKYIYFSMRHCSTWALQSNRDRSHI